MSENFARKSSTVYSLSEDVARQILKRNANDYSFYGLSASYESVITWTNPSFSADQFGQKKPSFLIFGKPIGLFDQTFHSQSPVSSSSVVKSSQSSSGSNSVLSHSNSMGNDERYVGKDMAWEEKNYEITPALAVRFGRNESCYGYYAISLNWTITSPTGANDAHFCLTLTTFSFSNDGRCQEKKFSKMKTSTAVSPGAEINNSELEPKQTPGNLIEEARKRTHSGPQGTTAETGEGKSESETDKVREATPVKAAPRKSKTRRGFLCCRKKEVARQIEE